MRIQFVCTGNACRSALAEVILRKMLNDNSVSGVEVGSCGTHFYSDLDRDEIMCGIAAEHGYDMGGKAVQMTEELLDSADIIIVMTEHQHNEVTRLLRYDNWDRIVRFNDYCFNDPSDLPDPHFQSEYVYRKCFDTIERGCREIVKKSEVLIQRKSVQAI